jgi:hypothetical protein
MARKKSLWSELQRERDRRERVARAQERTQQQLIRQMAQDRERAQRRVGQADAAERKRQEQLAHEAGAAAAKAMKEELDSRLAGLRTLLTSALRAAAVFVRHAEAVCECAVLRPGRSWQAVTSSQVGGLRATTTWGAVRACGWQGPACAGPGGSPGDLSAGAC